MLVPLKIIWLPCQRPLTKQKIKYRLIICTQRIFIRWKDCENRSSISWHIRLNMPIFWTCRTRRSQMSSVNSVTDPNFTKFLHDIEAAFTLLMCTLRQRYPVPFQTARATNEGSLPFFPHNWLPWQCPLRYQKKMCRSIICTQNAFIWWKDCENRSSGSWDNYSPSDH